MTRRHAGVRRLPIHLVPSFTEPQGRPLLATTIAATVGLIASLGCQALPGPPPAPPIERAPEPRGEGVGITGAARWWVGGRAAVVGPDTVLTVAHVLAGQTEGWVSTSPSGGGLVAARVIGELPTSPEPVLVVRVATDPGLLGLLGFGGFAPARRFVAGAGAAAMIETARGREPLVGAQLQPGDSGSPILDAGGGLVGLLCGRRAGVPVFVRLRPGDLVPDERRLAPPAATDLIARTWGRRSSPGRWLW